MNTGSANELAGFIREIMTFLRQMQSSGQWDRWLGITSPNSPSSAAPTYVSSTSFTLVGDWTTGTTAYPPIAEVYRRVRCTVTAGTVYGYVSAAVFAAGITTMTVVLDSGALDSGLSEVQWGALAPTTTGNTAMPQNFLNLIALPPNYKGTATGTDTYAVTLAPVPANLAALQGVPIFVTFGNANTTTSTLAANGFAATPIRKYSQDAIVELYLHDIEVGPQMLIYDGTQFLMVGISNQIPQLDTMARTYGFKGSSSGNTQFTGSATGLQLRPSATNGKLRLPGFTGGSTLDISTSGPAVNGRDQSGAFGATATIHIFAICTPDGLTTGMIASLSSTQPTLPTGYTNYGYLFSAILTGGNFPALYVYGDRVTFSTQVLIVNAVAPGSATNQTYTSLVPTVAMSVVLDLSVAAVASGGAGASTLGRFGLTNVANGPQLEAASPGTANFIGADDVIVEWPNIGSLYYQCINVAGAGSSTLSASVVGYTVPNNS